MLNDGIHLYSWATGKDDRVIAVGDGDQSVLTNDARCDPRGRLWVETITSDFWESASTLFRVDDARLVPVIEGCTLANGLGWSPDSGQMYFVDSQRQTIEAFEYELDTGCIASRRTWVTIPAAEESPDGLTVDAEGCVWVAMYGGGAVRRYDTDAHLVDTCGLPVSKVTSLCFSEPGFTDVYVTSPSAELTPQEREAEAHPGCTFVFRDAGIGQELPGCVICATSPAEHQSPRRCCAPTAHVQLTYTGLESMRRHPMMTCVPGRDACVVGRANGFACPHPSIHQREVSSLCDMWSMKRPASPTASVLVFVAKSGRRAA